MNLCRKIHPNLTMANGPKLGGHVWGEEQCKRHKKCKRHKYHPKMNLCRKFHPNLIMGKRSKIGQKVWDGRGEIRGRGISKKIANMTNANPK